MDVRFPNFVSEEAKDFISKVSCASSLTERMGKISLADVFQLLRAQPMERLPLSEIPRQQWIQMFYGT